MINSTPTAVDANEERKRILAEVTLLKQERDTARRECTQWIEARDAVKGEVAAHLGLLKLTKDHDAMLSTTLLAKRDAIRNEIGVLEGQRNARKLEEDNLIADISKKVAVQADLERKQADLKADIDKHTTVAKEAHREHEKNKEQKSAEIAALEKKLADAKSELDRIKNEGDGIEKKNRDEDIRLATKGRDLAIYEARIREAAGKLDPPMNIILT